MTIVSFVVKKSIDRYVPSRSVSFDSAPRDNSKLTQSRWPFDAATCKAECLFFVNIPMFTAALSNRFATNVVWPKQDAAKSAWKARKGTKVFHALTWFDMVLVVLY